MKNKFAILALALCAVLVFYSCSSDDEPAVQEEVDPPGAPPRTWDLHGNKLKRMFYDDDIVVYFDGDMDPEVTWMFKFTGDIWRHLKETYQVTPDQRLFAVMHGKGGGGTAAYYYSKD